jgi:phytoene dehydrogenase-like protein
VIRSWRWVLPALLAGLLAGFWAGARLERAAQRKARRDGPDIARIHSRFVRRLTLNEDQSAKLRTIFESRRERFKAIQREEHDKAAALRLEIDREIEAMLDAGQKARFAEMRARWEKKHAERMGNAP